MRLKFKWIYALFMAFFIQFSHAQEKTITGLVSENGSPLPGATVIVKGTSIGVSTDFDGNYSVKAKVGDVLEFSYVGMKTKNVKVGIESVINVTLESDTTLDEVVVVAYGTQTRGSVTGSVAEIKSAEIGKITASNVTQGLVGKVAGVQVANGSGMPGDGATIRIRGIGSLSVATPPLYVVDGVPFYGNINSINNQDIESMTILKDASAAALYGSRGASGVIIITTKKGSNKKTTVSIDSRTGFSARAVKDYDFITNEGTYYESYYQALKNTYTYNLGQNATTAAQNAANNLITGDQGLQYNAYTGVANNQVVDPLTGNVTNGSLKYNEDWSEYLFGDGFFTQTNFNISGGTDSSSHFISLGYEKNDGYVVNSGFEKITSRLRLDTKVNDDIKVGATFSYGHTVQDYLDGYTGGNTYSSPFYWIRAVAPIYPVNAYDFNGNPILNSLGQQMYDDGTGLNGQSPIRPFGSLQHPYATAVNDYKRRVRDNIFSSGFVDYKIIDGLTFTYSITGELTVGQDWSMDTQLYGDAVNVGGRVSNSSFRQLSFTQQQLLKYNKRINNHGFDAMIGHETLDRTYNYVGADRSKMLFDSPYLDQAAVIQGNTGGGEVYSLEGFFARIAYDYDNKYFLNLSARRDGSSRFAPDERWGNFFGVGASWIVSQENFFKKINWVNTLKLKSSFGQQGNDEIGYNIPYLTPQVVTSTTDSSLPIAYGPGDYLGNRNIKWETSTNFNVGFDTRLFDRLNIEFEYFKKSITDMLFNRPIPVSLTGFTIRPENIGDMNNKGYEISISADVIQTKDLTLTLNLNTTSYKNEITKLPANGLTNNFIVSENFIREEGGSAFDYYMREFAGVNPQNGAALFWMNVDDEDLSAGRILTEDFAEADLYRIGKSALPDFFGGFGANLTFKGFDFGIDFAYQMGGYATDGVWLSGLTLAPGGGLHSDFNKTWTPENTNASLPRVDVDDPRQFYSGSSLLLIESDYLSIQNLSFGYTFNKTITDKLGISRLRVYGLADNVHLWSKRQGYDPRQSGVTGASSNNYSLLRTVSFGLNLDF